jgi:hypothetical protein
MDLTLHGSVVHFIDDTEDNDGITAPCLLALKVTPLRDTVTVVFSLP